MSKIVALADVSSAASSNIAQKDLVDNIGKYPIFGASGFIRNVDFYKQENPYLAIVKDGAGVGRVFLLPEHSSVIGTMQYILPNENVDINFLYYVLVKLNLGRYYSGATIPHIYFKDYKNERFPLPTLEEQRKIAAILDKTNALITERKQQLEQLDLMIKSRFVEMFGDDLDDSQAELRDVCKIITDGTHQPPKFTRKGVPFLFVSNIVDGNIDYDTQKFISHEEYESLIRRTPIEIGDILLTIVGSYGNPAIVKSDRKFCFQRHIAYLKPKRERFASEYLHAALQVGYVKAQIEGRVRGVAQKTLNLSELKAIRVNTPPINMQTRFADFVRQTDKSKSEIKQGLKQLELQYNALMQQYFER
ncbi:hypothetical protein FACS1894127_2350 [Clostridia bacterium]|nr:hypothetical protein FACS1894127_2350 [Clostridia bacterium]